MKKAIAAFVVSAGLLAAPALAQQNEQQGLVNVNLQDIALQVPVSVAVPVGVAATVCGVNVLAQQNITECDAQSNSLALSEAIAGAMLGGGGGGGGANNQQDGLVNVNIQNLAIQVPVSVSLPVGIAANVCGISVLAARDMTTCDAETTSQGLTQAVARALLGQ